MDSEFSVKRPRKWAWLGVGLIGVAFIVMPLVFNMFERAPKGATMLKEFKPFMTTAPSPDTSPRSARSARPCTRCRRRQLPKAPLPFLRR